MFWEDMDLTEKEKDQIARIFKKALEMQTLKAKPEMVREMVPIERWVVDEYYIGKEGAYVYQYWKDQLIDIFGKNRGKYNEIVVTGSLGTGKTTFANLCMLRKLYELSCYTNVPGLFDLMPSSHVGIMYFNISKAQAELTGYGQFKGLVDSIPYFKEEFRRAKIESILEFPENLMVLYGSSSAHSIGLNIIGAILDEANFYGNTNNNQSVDKAQADYTKVSQMYSSIVNRSASRFISKGEDSSLSILVSSNTITSSFTDERIQKSLIDGENSKTKVINAKLWEVKPKGTYSDEMFWVFKGSNLVDPFIVKTVMDLREYLTASGLEDIPGDTVEEMMDRMKPVYRNGFIQIPIDFKKSFEGNISTALQDIAGVSVAPLGRLFNSHSTYMENVVKEMKHPFMKEDIIVATRDDTTVMDYLRKDWKPQHREKKRYIHIDQSVKTDCTGFASSYIKGYRKTPSGVYLPIVCVEMKLRISPPKPPRKISISKVQDFVFYLVNRWGLEIGYLSQDSYASAQALQIYEEADINCGLQSVDRNDTQYLNYVDMLYDNRIETYDYPPEREELFNLIHFRSKRKVDHPDGGSKDVMDAVVGSVYNAITVTNEDTPGGGNVGDLLEGMISSYEDDEFMTIEELML